MRRRLAEKNLLGLLGIDVLADAANLVVLQFEDEAVLIFVILAVGDFSSIRELDDHGVAIAINLANFAVEALGKELPDPRHELQDLILAALQSRDARRRAGNQPTDIVGQVRESGFDIALAERGPSLGDERFFLFVGHDRLSFGLNALANSMHLKCPLI